MPPAAEDAGTTDRLPSASPRRKLFDSPKPVHEARPATSEPETKLATPRKPTSPVNPCDSPVKSSSSKRARPARGRSESPRRSAKHRRTPAKSLPKPSAASPNNAKCRAPSCDKPSHRESKASPKKTSPKPGATPKQKPRAHVATPASARSKPRSPLESASEASTPQTTSKHSKKKHSKAGPILYIRILFSLSRYVVQYSSIYIYIFIYLFICISIYISLQPLQAKRSNTIRLTAREFKNYEATLRRMCVPSAKKGTLQVSGEVAERWKNSKTRKQLIVALINCKGDKASLLQCKSFSYTLVLFFPKHQGCFQSAHGGGDPQRQRRKSGHRQWLLLRGGHEDRAEVR